MDSHYRGYIIRCEKSSAYITYYCDALSVSAPTKVGVERAMDAALRKKRIGDLAHNKKKEKLER
jgi:hypothetical protein